MSVERALKRLGLKELARRRLAVAALRCLDVACHGVELAVYAAVAGVSDVLRRSVLDGPAAWLFFAMEVTFGLGFFLHIASAVKIRWGFRRKRRRGKR